MPIVISPKADFDLDEEFLYIAERNLDAAQRFLTAAQNSFVQLSQMSGMGVATNFKEIRFWPVPHFQNYLIFYRPINDGVEIVRVLHAARDWPRELEEEQNL